MPPPSHIPGSTVASIASGSVSHNISEPPNVHSDVVMEVLPHAMQQDDNDAAWRIGRCKRARIMKPERDDHHWGQEPIFTMGQMLYQIPTLFAGSRLHTYM